MAVLLGEMEAIWVFRLLKSVKVETLVLSTILTRPTSH